MPLYAFKGKSPRVHPTAFVAPTAVLIGDVTLHEHASVWFGTVLRGDMDRIEIGARSNVQDNTTIHTDENEPTIVGSGWNSRDASLNRLRTGTTRSTAGSDCSCSARRALSSSRTPIAPMTLTSLPDRLAP